MAHVVDFVAELLRKNDSLVSLFFGDCHGLATDDAGRGVFSCDGPLAQCVIICERDCRCNAIVIGLKIVGVVTSLAEMPRTLGRSENRHLNHMGSRSAFFCVYDDF